MIATGAISAIKIEVAGIVLSITSAPRSARLGGRYKGFLSDKAADVEISLPVDNDSCDFRYRQSFSRETPLTGLAFAGLEALFTGQRPGPIRLTIRTEGGILLENLLRVVMSLLLPVENGLLLHACGVLDGGGAHVFYGPSESGKSTIARLSAGKAVLTDELVPVRKTEGGYLAYGVPFVGQFNGATENVRGPVKALYLLNKASRFHCRRLNPREAMVGILSNVFFMGKDPSAIGRLLSVCAGLVESAPCYDLHFMPDEGLWSYIHGIDG